MVSRWHCFALLYNTKEQLNVSLPGRLGAHIEGLCLLHVVRYLCSRHEDDYEDLYSTFLSVLT